MNKYKFIFVVLLQFVFGVLFSQTDNYVLGSDLSGFDRSVYEPQLENEASEVKSYIDEVNNVFPDLLPSDFKIYEHGAYIYGTDQVEYSNVIDQLITAIPYNNYLAFNKITVDGKLWSNVQIDLKLNLDLGNCYEEDDLQELLQHEFEVYNDDGFTNYENAVSKTIALFAEKLKEAVCCKINLNGNKGFSSNLVCETTELVTDPSLSEGVEPYTGFPYRYISNTGCLLAFPTQPEKVWFNKNGSVSSFKINNQYYKSCVYRENRRISGGYRTKCSTREIPAYSFARSWEKGEEAQVGVGIAQEDCKTNLYLIKHKSAHDDFMGNGGLDSLVLKDLGLNLYLDLDVPPGSMDYPLFSYMKSLHEPRFRIIDYTMNNTYPCPSNDKGKIAARKLALYSHKYNELVIYPDGLYNTSGFWQYLGDAGLVYFHKNASKYDMWLYNPQKNKYMTVTPVLRNWEYDSNFTAGLINDLVKASTEPKTFRFLLELAEGGVFVAEAVALATGATAVSATLAPISLALGLGTGVLYLCDGKPGEAILSAVFIIPDAAVIKNGGKIFLNANKLQKSTTKFAIGADGALRKVNQFANISPELKKLLQSIPFKSKKQMGQFIEAIRSDPHFLALIERKGKNVVEAWKTAFKSQAVRTDPSKLANLSKWLDNGLDEAKLTKAFDDAPDGVAFYNKLDNAKSHYHQQVYIKDFDNIPGVQKTNYTSNGLTSGKSNSSWNNPDLDLPASEAANFTNAVAKDLPAGTKIYRVTGGNPAGGYWTKQIPNDVGDVIGGTAVRPEWNSFEKFYEFEVPPGGLKIWEGGTARQRVTDGVDDYILPGGDQQIFVPQVLRDQNFANAVNEIPLPW